MFELFTNKQNLLDKIKFLEDKNRKLRDDNLEITGRLVTSDLITSGRGKYIDELKEKVTDLEVKISNLIVELKMYREKE